MPCKVSSAANRVVLSSYLSDAGKAHQVGEIFMELVPDFWREKGYLVGGGRGRVADKSRGFAGVEAQQQKFERSLR